MDGQSGCWQGGLDFQQVENNKSGAKRVVKADSCLGPFLEEKKLSQKELKVAARNLDVGAEGGGRRVV